ncbi:hypothetical protein BgiMline_006564 [Biomphalaria glabrata]
MFRASRRCSELVHKVQSLYTMFRASRRCSELVHKVQSLYTMFRASRRCSELVHKYFVKLINCLQAYTKHTKSQSAEVVSIGYKATPNTQRVNQQKWFLLVTRLHQTHKESISRSGFYWLQGYTKHTKSQLAEVVSIGYKATPNTQRVNQQKWFLLVTSLHQTHKESISRSGFYWLQAYTKHTKSPSAEVVSIGYKATPNTQRVNQQKWFLLVTRLHQTHKESISRSGFYWLQGYTKHTKSQSAEVVSIGYKLTPNTQRVNQQKWFLLVTSLHQTHKESISRSGFYWLQAYTKHTKSQSAEVVSIGYKATPNTQRVNQQKWFLLVTMLHETHKESISRSGFYWLQCYTKHTKSQSAEVVSIGYKATPNTQRVNQQKWFLLVTSLHQTHKESISRSGFYWLQGYTKHTKSQSAEVVSIGYKLTPNTQRVNQQKWFLLVTILHQTHKESISRSGFYWLQGYTKHTKSQSAEVVSIGYKATPNTQRVNQQKWFLLVTMLHETHKEKKT